MLYCSPLFPSTRRGVLRTTATVVVVGASVGVGVIVRAVAADIQLLVLDLEMTTIDKRKQVY